MGEGILGLFKHRAHEDEAASPELAQARTAIVKSVLSDGLKSGRVIAAEGKDYFGSVDTMAVPFLQGCILHKDAGQTTENALRQIKRALYANGSTILPVIIERPAEASMYSPNARLPKDQVHVISTRIGSSFLVVCEVPKEQGAYINEERMAADKFYDVVFPDQIWAQVEPGLDAELKGRVPRTIVANKIKRSLMDMKSNFDMPDYESALLSLMGRSNGNLWVHGIRLPTQVDLNKTKPAVTLAR